MVEESGKVLYGFPLFSEEDIYLFKEGNHTRLFEKLGAHIRRDKAPAGVSFGVWCPNAERVSVVGDFNGWEPDLHPLRCRDDGSGIWEGLIPALGAGEKYKYHIVSMHERYRVDKGDPFAFGWETAPRTASVIRDLDYEWHDGAWMADRRAANAMDAPFSVYEVHLGSWRRVPEEGGRSLTYREIAPLLAEHVKEMDFTHVEFLPVMEHPFYGSWGYQTLGYFAPTSRYGTPQDFMYLVDYLHQQGIGVILDWVPSHFPNDGYGLVFFDGTHLYEHQDPREGFHPEWKSCIFNYGRHEVRAFLLSSAIFWLDRYHADGLRIDAVASMLYRDYARKDGEWVPNRFGGRENLEAISFLRKLNETVYREFPDVQTIAEESTSWPLVTRPVHVGGLGFGMKWDMGWMHDVLDYAAHDPIHRKYHHNELTFGMLYASSENFLLPFSHDEVVYGKRSLLEKMPGDDWQKFANLRLFLGYMAAYPGKNLLFMGGELGQRNEWDHERSLDWHLLAYPSHQGICRWVKEVYGLYRRTPALHRKDFDSGGFEWVDCDDVENSILCFLRKGLSPDPPVLVVCNFTPVPRHNYRVGVPCRGWWEEVLNSDAFVYGGSGQGNMGGREASPVPFHGREHSLTLTVPPLSIVFFRFKSDTSGFT